MSVVNKDQIRGILLLTVFLIVISGAALTFCPKDERFIETYKNIFPNSMYPKRIPLSGNLGATGSPNSPKELSTKIKANSLYSPIICRPPEHYGLNYSGQCTDELYPNQTSPFGKGEMAAPCKPQIESKYYAQRPIINFGSYEKMLTNLLNSIRDPVPEKGAVHNLKHPLEFCPGDCYTEVMNFIMNKINHAKKILPEFVNYAKNDTWGGEQFAFWNEKVFVFTRFSEQELSQQERAEIARYDKNGGQDRKYIISFSLHNTLRSSSTDIIATAYKLENRLYLDKIKFATKTGNPKNVPEGISIGRPGSVRGEINLNNNDLPVPEVPQWIFKNTIESKTFNSSGSHDPDASKNITILGGTPPEFDEYLDNHSQAYLLNEGSTTRLPGGYDGNVVYPNMGPKGENKEPVWTVKH
jgi:hypothetical protein